jgi:hypothetical protein
VSTSTQASVRGGYLSCPRCGLSIEVRPHRTAIRHCPRCVGRLDDHRRSAVRGELTASSRLTATAPATGRARSRIVHATGARRYPSKTSGHGGRILTLERVQRSFIGRCQCECSSRASGRVFVGFASTFGRHCITGSNAWPAARDHKRSSCTSRREGAVSCVAESLTFSPALSGWSS